MKDIYIDILERNMQININYLPHHRSEFHRLIFHFMDKIKPENKKKIKLNILSTGEKAYSFKGLPKDIETVTTCFPDENNYMQKIRFAVKQPEPYSVKLDEDIFFSNHVWDFIIENIEMLDDAMFMSPLISNGVPFVDDYMVGLFSNEERGLVENEFLRVEFEVSLGADYRPLNKHTIDASEWNPSAYWRTVKNEVNHDYKGVHPIRFSLKAHQLLNEFTSRHFGEIFGEKDFEIEKRNLIYFTNSFFAIRTDRWKEAAERRDFFIDPFDEVPVNKLMNESRLPALIIKNGYAIHPYYNYISGLTPKSEATLYSVLVKKIMG